MCLAGLALEAGALLGFVLFLALLADLAGVALFFAEDAAAVGLAVEVQLVADVDALLPAGAEVLVVEGDAILLGEMLGRAAHEVVLLVDAVKERRGEGVKAVFGGKARRLFEAPGVAHLAAAVRQGFGGQGFLEEVAQPVVFVGVEFHADFLGEFLRGL